MAPHAQEIQTQQKEIELAYVCSMPVAINEVVGCMSGQIGILVDGWTLYKSMRNRSTHEQIPLYRDIALSEGLNIILFALGGLSIRRGKVHGYVPTPAGWQRVTAPIPRVIHKRVLYHTGAPLRILDRLRRRGIVLVNPHRIQDKMRMYRVLAQTPAVQPHIPATWNYRWQKLARHLSAGESTILKPRIGSVGCGIYKVVPLTTKRILITGKYNQILSRSGVRHRLRARITARRYLLQQLLNLASYQGKPFDLRVPVQRNAQGEWVVPGMVAKVATQHPFLTNLAQGGQAIPGEVALNAAFAPETAARLPHQIAKLAIEVGQAVSGAFPHAADLGLDIGVDTSGKPWLIEVNTRDQRITFLQAGMLSELRTLYLNPLAYCAYLQDTARP